MQTIAPYADTTCLYFDLPAALNRCCGDEDFLNEMAEMLAITVETQLAVIEDAFRSRCAQELGSAAHALKGAVASMTTGRPYELLRDLEMCGKSGTCDGGGKIIAELHQCLDQLLAEIKQWSAHRNSSPHSAVVS